MIDKMLSSNLDGLQLSKDGYTRFFVFVIRNFNRLLLSGSFHTSCFHIFKYVY